MSTSQANLFELSEYKRLLSLTKEAYPCLGFDVIDSSDKSNFAIIRHDIDISPDQALELARIEADLNIKSTYTILLTGEFYNPFEQYTCELFRQISDLGHDLGLHFDATRYSISNEADLEKALEWEVSILNTLLRLPADKQVKMFSFHNTTPFTMSCKASRYAGLVNAYASYFQSTVQYTSDSNGYWIHRSWEQLLIEKHDRIQVLTHPEWWTPKNLFPAEKVCVNLANRQLKTWLNYCDQLQAGNRENRTGLSSDWSELEHLWPTRGYRILMLWLEGCCELAFLQLYNYFVENAIRILVKVFVDKFGFTPELIKNLLLEHKLHLDPVLALSVISEYPVNRLFDLSHDSLQLLKYHYDSLLQSQDLVARGQLTLSFDNLIIALKGLLTCEPLIIERSTLGLHLPTDSIFSCELVALQLWMQENQLNLHLSLDDIHQSIVRYHASEFNATKKP